MARESSVQADRLQVQIKRKSSLKKNGCKQTDETDKQAARRTAAKRCRGNKVENRVSGLEKNGRKTNVSVKTTRLL